MDIAKSRIHRFDPSFRWDGIPIMEYKQSAEHWCGIVRQVLIGANGEQTAFQVRYFEIAPGGFSSLEAHPHTHAVMVLRGHGEVQLGAGVHELSFGDVVYVAPNEVHQFRNAASEPFGSLRIVDAQR